MPPPAFHYIKHGRSFGPVGARDLLQMVENGVISGTDLVRVVGLTGWTPAHKVVADVRGGFLDTAPPAGPGDSQAACNRTVFTSAPPQNAVARPGPAGRRLKKCVHCGARTRADAGFCHRCRGDLAARGCRECLGVSPPGSQFCGLCGKPL